MTHLAHPTHLAHLPYPPLLPLRRSNQLAERHGLRHVAPELLVGPLKSWNRAPQIARRDAHSGRQPSQSARQRFRSGIDQRKRVHSTAGSVPSILGVALPDGNGNDSLTKMQVEEERHLDLAMARFDGQQLILFGAQSPRGIRMHFGPVEPDRLGDRVGNLLQPRPIRTAAIVEMQ